jgi:hypothetical protein
LRSLLRHRKLKRANGGLVPRPPARARHIAWTSMHLPDRSLADSIFTGGRPLTWRNCWAR